MHSYADTQEKRYDKTIVQFGELRHLNRSFARLPRVRSSYLRRDASAIYSFFIADLALHGVHEGSCYTIIALPVARSIIFCMYRPTQRAFISLCTYTSTENVGRKMRNQTVWKFAMKDRAIMSFISNKESMHTRRLATAKGPRDTLC